MNRIKNKFDQLKNSNKKALGIFLTAGDPDFETSLNIIEKLPDKGVDFIEIGMPFSDPMADGPSIQLSSQRALKSGMNIKKCFMLVENFRKKNSDIPIILMGYFNPIYIFGKTKFIEQCKKSGVDGLIIVDLPPGTGDAHLSIMQHIPLSGVIIVTTPEEVAVADTRKAVDMFKNPHLNQEILGVVENMSFFQPEENGSKYYIFGKEGGKRLCEENNLELLGELPILEDKSFNNQLKYYRSIAGAIVQKLAVIASNRQN